MESSRRGPTPALWDRMMFFCSRVRCAVGMRVWASNPKPVLIPYAAASPAASLDVAAWESRTDRIARSWILTDAGSL